MRWVFRLVGALVVAVVVAAVGLLLLPGTRIAGIAADQIKARTGRELTIGEPVKVTLWPVLGVETGPVTFANADWAGREPMLRADSVRIGVSAPDLLRGVIRVTEIVASGPDLRLQTRADGRGNWQFFAPADAAAPAGEGSAAVRPGATLERLSLSGARLVYAAAGAAPVEFSNVDLDLDWPEPDGPADLRATLRPAGAPVTVTARVDAFAGFLGGAVAPVTAQVSAPGGSAFFDGRAGASGSAAGRITVETADTGKMLAALGLGNVTLPRGLGRAIKATGDLTYTADGRLALREMTLDLDGNRLDGAADVTLNGKPSFTARLDAGTLDFSDLATAAPGNASPSAAADTGWSTRAIDASALGLADGALTLIAESIDTGSFKLGATQIGLTIDRSRAVLDLVQVEVFEGWLSGQLVANNRNGLSVGGRLQANDIGMRAALGALAGIERLSGKSAASIEFLGSGNSEAAIMRSLSGKGRIEMKGGVIDGIDLDRLMRSGDASGGTTVFDSLTATFTMSAGDLFNQDLLLTLSNYRADGAGRIGLGARDIDYLFTPVALRANAGKGLAIPVRIKGPWADPRILPDLSEALQSEIDVKVDEVERKAKDALQRKLEDELDVQVPEGQDPKEVLKDRLEDEAKRQLLKLLGRD